MLRRPLSLLYRGITLSSNYGKPLRCWYSSEKSDPRWDDEHKEILNRWRGLKVPQDILDEMDLKDGYETEGPLAEVTPEMMANVDRLFKEADARVAGQHKRVRMGKKMESSDEAPSYARTDPRVRSINANSGMLVNMEGIDPGDSSRWRRARKQHHYATAVISALEGLLIEENDKLTPRGKLAVGQCGFNITKVKIGAKEAHLRLLWTVEPPKDVTDKFSHAPIRDQVQKSLDAMVPALRFEVARVVASKYAPEISFKYDVSVDFDSEWQKQQRLQRLEKDERRPKNVYTKDGQDLVVSDPMYKRVYRFEKASAINERQWEQKKRREEQLRRRRFLKDRGRREEERQANLSTLPGHE